MKKYISLIIALIMTLSLAACGDSEANGENANSQTGKNSSGVKFTQIEKGYALDTDGRIWSFSLVDDLKLFCDSAKFTYIYESNGFKCALDENAGLWTWGQNTSGQLGDGTTTASETPKKVLDGVKMVTGNYGNGFAIKTDGSLYQWGNGNTYMKLREQDSDRDNILTPTLVKTDAKFTYVAAGGSSSACIAIDTNGTRYVWGAYTSIMGSDETVIPFSLHPAKGDKAPLGTYYFGNGTTYIIDSYNTLYISGGKGSRLDPFENTPSFNKYTKAFDKVAMIAPSLYGTLYIDIDGNIWGWGSDAFKICSATTTPIQITKDIKFTDVTILDSGSVMAYALAEDGNIYTFGEKNSTPEIVKA